MNKSEYYHWVKSRKHTPRTKAKQNNIRQPVPLTITKFDRWCGQQYRNMLGMLRMEEFHARRRSFLQRIQDGIAFT